MNHRRALRLVAGLLGLTAVLTVLVGHSVADAVTAVGLVLVLLPPGRQRWKWELRAAVFATFTSLSRAYLGARWFSDVVAGGLLGTALAIGWPAVLEEVRQRVRALVPEEAAA